MALTQQQLEKLRQVRMFVLDMDGTIYLGESLFPFTKGFLRRVEETGRDFCFFTNNSSKNREAYLEKLARMGISLPPEKMLISNGACDLIRAGRPVYGVNPDWNCPTENGFLPDCGSIAALITASTGVSPEFFGKPSRHTLEYLLAKTGCREEELAIVGDRLYTDIQIAQGTKVTSILVLSGETQPEDLKTSESQPDLVCRDLEELSSLL